jgi:hypothetical protein
LGREKLKRKVQLLLLGLKRERIERKLKRGSHMFFISLRRSEERAVKWLFVPILRFCPYLPCGLSLKIAYKLKMKLSKTVSCWLISKRHSFILILANNFAKFNKLFFPIYVLSNQHIFESVGGEMGITVMDYATFAEW